MTGPPRPAPRAGRWRVPVAVTEIVGFTWLAHVAAGGETPATGHLLAVAVLVSVAATLLRHRLLRLPVVVLAVLAAQVGLHLAFTQGSGHLDHVTSGVDSGMLLAHGVGAVVTTLALTWQEQVLVRLVERLVPRVLDVRPAGPRAAARSAVPQRPLIGLVHGTAFGRRGPPVVDFA